MQSTRRLCVKLVRVACSAKIPRVSRYSGCRAIHHRNGYCTAAADIMPPPHVEGTLKEYPEKITSLVDQIGQLTLIEIADLNELLKSTLNIKDAPMMMGSAMAASAPQKQEEEEEAEAPQAVKTQFTVKMMKFDPAKKVAVIKEVKKMVSGMNLVQAKKLVESAPQNIMVDISKEEAEKLKEALEAVGATVEIE